RLYRPECSRTLASPRRRREGPFESSYCRLRLAENRRAINSRKAFKEHQKTIETILIGTKAGLSSCKRARPSRASPKSSFLRRSGRRDSSSRRVNTLTG